MTSPLLPGDRPTPRSLLPAPLLTLVLAAGAVAVAVMLGPEPARGAVGTTGTVAALLLCAAVTRATHAVLSARALRTRLETADADVDRLIQERTRQAEEYRRQHERLTGELTRERARLSAELDQERAHLAQSLAAERDRLNEHHDITVARLAQEHAAERARLTDDHTAERARLTEQHTAEIARLTGDHAASLARLADEHAGELRRREEEHDARTAALLQEHSAERDRLRGERDRLGEERERLSRDRDRHIDENARLAVRLREANSARAAALSATANAAGRMQALSTGMLADLRAMEDKHHDEEVLADLLHLDHRTAQAGRLADSVAVLTGARSGRRWARPISMESILRGAMGRISGYRRVRVHSAADISVAGHAAEGVMHALAELLDNAANFSPPTAEVHVYVEEVPAGVIVSVEDSGLVMGEAQLRRAERAVAGETAGIGGLTGTRLGLAVVGRLARRYGLRVSYRPSARGGTGVLMLIPQDLLVQQDAPKPSLPRTTAPAARTAPAATAGHGTPPGTAPKAPAAGQPRTPTSTAGGPSAAVGGIPSAAVPSRTAPAGTPAHNRSAQPPASGPKTSAAGRSPAPAATGPEPSTADGLPQRRRARPDDTPAVHPADDTPPRTDHAAPHREPDARKDTRGTRAAHAVPPTETERDTPGPSSTPGHSYAASRAGADLDPDPVPVHESPGAGKATGAGADTAESPLVLPRRRRGRTLAEAERARSQSRTASPRQAPPTAEETKARTARFTSFRQAVRATPAHDTTTHDTATDATATDPGTEAVETVVAVEATEGAPTGAAPQATPTTPTPATPEGDTTS
ncbi:ATP-binding protein [Streptomyces sp. NEAU-W12]|uniref:ATP-binding protein n=1 Tax=Streptomyces sp. NEAU-W12 TaxID=2994668 RepID=UPI00224A54F5|nr:ATP-binding protein [Streptomyces sp. NEAU-W12]MCX2925650.1 ATP-binding protein [Streptomyces sp. NEAU-W12]